MFTEKMSETHHCETLLEDISPGSKGNGGESIYGPTFEGRYKI